MNLDKALEYARAVGLTDRQVAVVVKQEADRVRFRADNGQVTLTHPGLETDIEVHPDTVTQWEQSGWTRKKESK
jgi:hypothetical protein